MKWKFFKIFTLIQCKTQLKQKVLMIFWRKWLFLQKTFVTLNIYEIFWWNVYISYNWLIYEVILKYSQNWDVILEKYWVGTYNSCAWKFHYMKNRISEYLYLQNNVNIFSVWKVSYIENTWHLTIFSNFIISFHYRSKNQLTSDKKPYSVHNF